LNGQREVKTRCSKVGQVGSSLSADGVQPELQLLLYLRDNSSPSSVLAMPSSATSRTVAHMCSLTASALRWTTQRPYVSISALSQLPELTDSILAYIRERKTKGLSNTTVNMEIEILRRVLKRAKRWHFVEDEIPRLPERRDIGRALQPDEKLHQLHAAKSRPEWETAYLAEKRDQELAKLAVTLKTCSRGF